MPVMCHVCKHVLNVGLNRNGVYYLHPGPFGPDHEPQPVEATGDVERQCDFCSEPAPAFEVPANDFRVPAMPEHNSGGSWAACAECARWIEENRWNALLRRVQLAYIRTHGEDMSQGARARLKGLYRALRQNITGPVRPIP